MSSVTILDVGHGNCTVIRSDGGVFVVDVAPKSILLDYLRQHAIGELDSVLISHADSDHVGGLVALLASGAFRVNHVYINADARKDSITWQEVKVAARIARLNGRVRIKVGLTTETSAELQRGDLTLEVLAPTPEIAMSAATGTDLEGRRLNTNATSAVIGVTFRGVRHALLTGDMEDSTLERLMLEHSSLDATILVFPHHGGQSGTNPEAFAASLATFVRPKLVVFSMARGRYKNPLPAVIAGVISVLPAARIACTQLSQHCAPSTPTLEPHYLFNVVAAGRRNKECCAGTIELDLMSGHCQPEYVSHLTFIQQNAPTALCHRPEKAADIAEGDL